jgi:hypothetical protein
MNLVRLATLRQSISWAEPSSCISDILYPIKSATCVVQDIKDKGVSVSNEDNLFISPQRRDF